MKISLSKIATGLLAFMVFNTVMAKGKNFKLHSPDGTIVVEIKVDQTISYSVFVDQKEVVNNATLALTVNENVVLGSNAKILKKQSRSLDQMLYPELKVKSAEIRDHFNEITLTFKGNYKVIFRAFSNGIAYRFETQFKEDIIVTSETAKFNFADNHLVYFPREDEFQSHNERLYECLTLDSLSNNDLCSLPTLIATSGKTKLLITETGLLDYPGMWLTGGKGNNLQAVFPPVALEEKVDNTRWTDDRTIRVSKKANYIAKTKGTRGFPWRIIAISKTDADLITNQLTYQLAEPSKLADCSWIKPGKVAWDWWNYNNIYGVDFKAGVNTETYKYYIDFASKYGLEYIILDEGWYKLGDVLDVVSEVDVEGLIRYGKEKNVGVILWVTWSSLDQKLEAALDAFQEVGS